MTQDKKITQAVMLAGGKGVRLMPLTIDTPKPLVLVNGKPFFNYVIDLLKKNGITEILFLLGEGSEKILEYYGDGSRFGIAMRYHHGDKDEESGLRMKHAKDMIQDEFMVVYNDNYWPLELDTLLAFHREKNLLGTVNAYTNKDKYSRNNIFIDASGVVEKYDSSRLAPELNGVELGFSLMHKGVLDLMPEKNLSFTSAALPALVERRQLAGFLTDKKYYTIGSFERFKQTEDFLRSLYGEK